MEMQAPGILQRFRLAIFGDPLPPLDPRLAAMEQVFKAPPLTRSLTRSIELIAPHLNLRPTEADRALWQAEQNAECWADWEALGDVLPTIRTPARILEIGPGLGRSLVFFSKKLGWEDCELHAYEGDGSQTKYTMDGPRFDDSFCGNIAELKRVLAFNGINNVAIHDAKLVGLRDLPGPFDFIYGFYNIGFHWSLKHFLDDILSLMASHGVATFTVTEHFQPFNALVPVNYRLISKQKPWPPDHVTHLIVITQENTAA